jgi:segregation and condensation protein B
MENIKNIIESLLFVAEEPLTVDRLKRILAQAEPKEIRKALDDIAAEYDSRKGGFYLHQVAGGYQVRTRPEYSTWIKRLIQPKPLRLSKAALETLAIVAYKQPVIRSDIEHIRGVDCGGVLRVLLERKFIRVLGRKEIPGRPLIYATTRRFLEVFDLKTLKDLPTPKEIEELGNSPLEQSAETPSEDSDRSESENAKNA